MHLLCAAGQGGNSERFAYILAPQKLVPGDSVTSGPGASIKIGNSLPLSAIPIGTALHNVEMNPGKGGQLARSAGTAARLVSRGMRSCVSIWLSATTSILCLCYKVSMVLNSYADHCEPRSPCTRHDMQACKQSCSLPCR